jgi:hypothetical protein
VGWSMIAARPKTTDKILARIRTLAGELLNRHSWEDDPMLPILHKCFGLTRKNPALAIRLHKAALEYAVDGLNGVGCLPIGFADLVSALCDLVYSLGTVYQEGEYSPNSVGSR